MIPVSQGSGNFDASLFYDILVNHKRVGVFNPALKNALVGLQ